MKKQEVRDIFEREWQTWIRTWLAARTTAAR